MFFHNLKVAWRNLIKYKIQNIIAILCLSIGMLCVSVTYHYIINAWESGIWKMYDNNFVEFHLYDNNGHEITNNDYLNDKTIHSENIGLDVIDFARKLEAKHLPSIKKIHYSKQTEKDVKIKNDKTAYSIEMPHARIMKISPEWLKYNRYHSAITGNLIDNLKPGDIIVLERYLDARRGTDLNLMDYEIHGISLEGNTKIKDVIASKSNGISEDNYSIYVVSDERTYDKLGRISLIIELNEDTSREILYKEIIHAFPKIHFKFEQHENEKVVYNTLFIFLIVLGLSVLIISLSGFLKMQLQLFMLRKREIALRRCNGATPFQLFNLLFCEVLIVFIFVVGVLISITALLNNYLMPILNTLLPFYTLDINLLYQEEILFSFVVFFVTIIIAVLSVHHTLNKPLGMTVGKSISKHTFGYKIMLLLQYMVCFIFMSIVFIIYNLCMYEHIFYYPNNINDYKQTVCISTSNFNDSTNSISNILSSMKTIEDYAFIDKKYYIEDSMRNDLINNPQEFYNEENHKYSYSVAFITESFFKALGIKIYDTTYKASKKDKMCYIISLSKDAAKYRKKWGLKTSNERKYVNLSDGTEYEYIGCFKSLNSNSLSPNTNEFIIQSNDYIFNGTENSNIILKPNKCGIKALKEEVLFNLVKNNPKLDHYSQAYYKTIDIPFPSFYDVYYSSLKLLIIVEKLCMVLVAVSLLCIILSIYSSVSLDTRGRQKEVAIRKINGAKVKNIILLFAKPYIKLFTISSFIVLPFIILITFIICKNSIPENQLYIVIILIISILLTLLINAAVTILTIWQKLYKIAHSNPSEMINRE